MKLYESAECGRRFMPLLPIIGRVDGRAFHSFTRGMERPFDDRMIECMREIALRLIDDTDARIAYTQSDEITLAWYSDSIKSQVWFDGRITKMTSQLAALATLHFYRAARILLPNFIDLMPSFDARVWQVPNLTEASNVFVWREWDAIKNSVTMAAQSVFSHNQLHGKDSREKLSMLSTAGIEWDDYPVAFKRGTYFRRVKVSRPFSAEEIERLPEKHEARSNPALTIERQEIRELQMDKIANVDNRVGVLFHGEEATGRKTRGGE